MRLIVRSSTPSRSQSDEVDVPRADLRLADDPRSCLWHRLSGEDGIGELLVLVPELGSLGVPVQLRAGEPDGEVAPVVSRQRAGEVVRAGRDRVAARADRGVARGEDPAVARGRSRLDGASVSTLCRQRCAVAATGSGSSPRTYDATTRSASPRACATSPSTQRASGSSWRPAASISGSTSTSVSSINDGQTSSAAQVATPGPAPTSSSERGRQSGRCTPTCLNTAAAAANVAGAR